MLVALGCFELLESGNVTVTVAVTPDGLGLGRGSSAGNIASACRSVLLL